MVFGWLSQKNRDAVYVQIKESLVVETKFKFRAKKFVGLTNAISLANDGNIKKALQNGDRELAIRSLENLINNYKKATPHLVLNIHLHTKEVKSFVRSWNLEKFGDDLSSFRDSIVKVKNVKKALSVYEIGRAGLLLRSIVPILGDNREYLGSLEFIQGIESIARVLDKRGDGFILLMDKRKAKTELFNDENIFQENYIISQNFISSDFLKDAKNISIDRLFKNGFYISDKYFYTYIDKKGMNGENLGIALVGTNLSKVNAAIDTSRELTNLVLIVILILGVVLFITLGITIRKFVLVPLGLLNKALTSFFEYLADSKKEIEYIEIVGDDEFAQMGKKINKSIKVSSAMHGEISNLINTMDKNVIVSETDSRGIITYASEAFCKISGYTKDELMGKNHSIMRHQDMPDILYKDMWESLKRGDVWSGEIKNLKKDGGFYWVYVILTPKCVGGIESCGHTAIKYDITDRKEVEDLTQNLEHKIQERTLDLSLAKQKIEEVHKTTKESIEYASLLQGVLIPKKIQLDSCFKDHFIIWEPRDIVGGDIYLFESFREKDESVLMCIDCTGHGVPGAFVTILVKAIERQMKIDIINTQHDKISPAWILKYFNGHMKKLLKQETKDSLSNVGFDAGVLYYNKKEKLLRYAGADTPLYYIDSEDRVQTIKGDRSSVGYRTCDAEYEYKEFEISIEDGMKFYIATDGFIDQKGGIKGLPFGKTRFKNIIEKNHKKSMSEQKEILLHELKTYQGDTFRVDDITLIGLEVKE